MFRTVPLSSIRRFSLYTQQCYVIQITACEQDQDGAVLNLGRKLSANPYDIHHCCVYSARLLMLDRGTVRNM